MARSVYSASNRNEYQEFSWGKRRPMRKADNHTAVSEPTVETSTFKILQSFAVCYKDSFIIFTFVIIIIIIITT
jgi:hypothetical protein